MSDEIIRPMTPADVPAVAALEKRCFSDPWSEASLRAELKNPLSDWLVAERDGVLCGYAGSQTVPPESDVMNVAVAPEVRRQGLARQLMDALWRALQAKGSTTLTLEVRVSNTGAIALYEGMGFRLVGRRPRYYRSPTEDALLLRLGGEGESPC